MLFEVGGSVKDTQCGFKLFKANAAWPNWKRDVVYIELYVELSDINDKLMHFFGLFCGLCEAVCVCVEVDDLSRGTR